MVVHISYVTIALGYVTFLIEGRIFGGKMGVIRHPEIISPKESFGQDLRFRIKFGITELANYFTRWVTELFFKAGGKIRRT